MTIRRLFGRMGLVCLAVAVLPSSGLAGAPTTNFTTLPALVEPNQAEVDVSADKAKTPQSRVVLSADLRSLPPRARLTSCALRLVTSSGIPEADDNGVALQLFDATEDVKSTKSIAARTVDPGTDPNAAIVMQTQGLCASLQKGMTAVDPASATMTVPVKFRLQTTTSNGLITLYGRPAGDASSRSPRLMLTYELPDSWPPVAGWSQPRGDARHTGRSAWRMYNPDGAYTPGGFAVRSLGSSTFAQVSPPVLLYRRQVLAAVPDGSAIQMMNGAGTVVNTLKLPVAAKFMGVSQHGWVYATGENKLVLKHIETGRQIPIETGNETVLVPPTIGADGGFYVVTNQYVYGYPAPPVDGYSPLWRYNTGASSNNDVSAVALGEDGRTAYVVDKQSASMIALDTATGAVKWTQPGLEISKAANDPMPVPVVAGTTVFVTNQAPSGTALYIVEDDAETPSLVTKSGNGVGAPAVGPDNSAYYFRDGELRRIDANLTETPVGGAGCDGMAGFDLLRADQSGNLYALDRIKKRFAYIAAGAGAVPAGACAPVSLPVGSSLAIAADGTALGYDEKRQIHAIVATAATFGAGNALTLSNDFLKLSPDKNALTENNDMTFRAGKTIGTAAGLILPANTNINLVAGERIAFAPGLRVVQGAQVRARAGF